MSFINCSITAALTAVLILYVPNLVKPPLPKQATLWAAPKWRKVADTYRLVEQCRLIHGSSVLGFC